MKTQHLFDQPGFLKTFENLVRELRAFPTVKSLKSSSWFQQNEIHLRQLLEYPYVDDVCSTLPSGKQWIRCVSWNIEKGKKFAELANAFTKDNRLFSADVILLQEADFGMARSGNRFIAHELARVLNMNSAFAPCFIEMTKGVDDDLKSVGDNAVGIQGNALLSRYPIQRAQTVIYPRCFEPFESAEKRYGNRNALVCDLEVNGGIISFVSTHLEVRNTPGCRARQMMILMKALKQHQGKRILISGDFNSNTFSRGNAWRTLKGFLRLATSSHSQWLASILKPQGYEPLFAVLRQNGFEWESFNDGRATASTQLHSLEDIRFVPKFVRRRVFRILSEFENGLPLRLDWFAGRNLSVVCEMQGPSTLGKSAGPIPPQTLEKLFDGHPVEYISDHRPILIDLKIPF